MRKILLLTACLAASAAACMAGCTKSADYRDYISENRYNVYIFSGDDAEIKIYCSEKESPYLADGIKGALNSLVEIYAEFEKDYSEVNVSSESFTGGEMSYLTVKNCWYLSFSGSDFSSDEIKLEINSDGKNQEFTLMSVLSDGVMSGEKALDCVKEYNSSLFSSLTENGIFRGEIFIRLLYDEKCYYYVGVCDRNGKISAFLVDGETGKIIAETEHRM